MKKRIIFVIVFAFAGIVCSSMKASGAQLTLGTVGATLQLQDSMLYTAVPIINTGTGTIQVTITAIKLKGGTLTQSLPFTAGAIPPKYSTSFEADFASLPGALFTPGDTYSLTVTGTYKIGEKKPLHKFTLTGNVLLAPDSPGSATVSTTASIPSQTVTGAPYKHRAVEMDSDVNTAAPPVPTLPFAPLITTSAPTGLTPWSNDPPPFDHVLNDSLNLISGTGAPDVANGTVFTSGGVHYDFGAVEPSGAVDPVSGVVLVTANWTLAYSVDGVHFTQLDPTKIFPNDVVGFCCDQQVQYVPAPIDRFIWLMQGPGGDRLAAASPGGHHQQKRQALDLLEAYTAAFRPDSGHRLRLPGFVGGKQLSLHELGCGGTVSERLQSRLPGRTDIVGRDSEGRHHHDRLYQS